MCGVPQQRLTVGVFVRVSMYIGPRGGENRNPPCGAGICVHGQPATVEPVPAAVQEGMYRLREIGRAHV